jgi:hypothetical protein
MTMPIRFDTLEYARKLAADAGLSPAQAEAQAQALGDAMAEATVSPSELVLLRSDLIARMDILKSDMVAKMDVLKTDLLKALERRFDAKLEALEQRMSARFTTAYWLLAILLAVQGATMAAVVNLLLR